MMEIFFTHIVHNYLFRKVITFSKIRRNVAAGQ